MKTEATVAQYEACVNAGACTSTGHDTNSSSSDCNYGNASRSDHPMNCVNWYGAGEYCSWIGARLPTQDEWYAEASNNGDRTYPWGNMPQASCTHCIMNAPSAGGAGCGNDSTMPVGSKPLGDSVSGISGLSGNVSEWTTSPIAQGNDQAYYRAFRGGDWLSDFQFDFTADGGGFNVPRSKVPMLGLRCVSVLGP